MDSYISQFFIYYTVLIKVKVSKGKAVLLHALEALGGRGDIAPTHS
jgi:hypothetical protein